MAIQVSPLPEKYLHLYYPTQNLINPINPFLVLLDAAVYPTQNLINPINPFLVLLDEAVYPT